MPASRRRFDFQNLGKRVSSTEFLRYTAGSLLEFGIDFSRKGEMSLNLRFESGVFVLDLKGKLTIGESSAQMRELVRELSESRCRNILVNLLEVTYMDSIGVGSLVAAYTTVTNKGGQMKLLHLGKRVHHLLSITKLLTVFEAFEDERAAIKSFGERA